MKVAREGVPLIAGAWGIAIVANVLAQRSTSWLAWTFAALTIPVAAWVVYFFRDPERTGDRGDTLVVAPADGRVVHITEVDEPSFLHGKAIRISIFMNVFNVHVNRYPIGGVVQHVHYNRGKFLNAAVEKASLENEQMSVGIARGPHRVLVRQIAGLIARRIVTYSKEGDVVQQGDRYGLIRFGSRVDVFVPAGSHLRVSPGAGTLSGVTALADLP